MKHTKTPWSIWNPESEIHLAIDSCDGLIAQTLGTNEQANAAHIVKCVNAHDGLVEALKACYEHMRWQLEKASRCGDPDSECVMQDAFSPSGEHQTAVKSARDALRSAGIEVTQ